MVQRPIWMGALASLAAVIGTGPLFAPQLLAFPYHASIDGSQVWSETPLPRPQLQQIMARTQALVAHSPLADPAGERRHVFLTQGGWRWNWLALQNRNGFALSRAFSETIIINRSDLAADRVVINNAMIIDTKRIGGVRSLSDTLAHEVCHGMERRRYGAIRSDLLAPQWLREGYCDHVAQASSLSDEDVARLKAAGKSHGALVYYEGRKRVAAILAGNGNDVDALFAMKSDGGEP